MKASVSVPLKGLWTATEGKWVEQGVL